MAGWRILLLQQYIELHAWIQMVGDIQREQPQSCAGLADEQVGWYPQHQQGVMAVEGFLCMRSYLFWDNTVPERIMLFLK